MEHSKHIIRAVLLLVVAAVGFVLVRHFAIPDSFGKHGPYRYNSVEEHAAKKLVHGAPGSCVECHEEQAGAVSEGKHAAVSCETCHAALASHVVDGERIAEMAIQPAIKLCGWCHERLGARPKEFPQVAIKAHLAENEVQESQGVCLECHNAHDPSKSE